MIKLNRMTDYAILIIGTLHSNSNRILSSVEIAKNVNLNQSTVAKIVKILSSNNLIKTNRGVNGGCSLTKSVSEINLVDVIPAIEGPIALTACVEGADVSCGVRNSCFMDGSWNKINNAIRGALENISLAELFDPSLMFPKRDDNTQIFNKKI